MIVLWPAYQFRLLVIPCFRKPFQLQLCPSCHSILRLLITVIYTKLLMKYQNISSKVALNNKIVTSLDLQLYTKALQLQNRNEIVNNFCFVQKKHLFHLHINTRQATREILSVPSFTERSDFKHSWRTLSPSQ